MANDSQKYGKTNIPLSIPNISDILKYNQLFIAKYKPKQEKYWFNNQKVQLDRKDELVSKFYIQEILS